MDNNFEESMVRTMTLVHRLTKALIDDGVNPTEIAPILIKHGLEIYKTILDEEAYNKIVDVISEKRNEIRTLE